MCSSQTMRYSVATPNDQPTMQYTLWADVKHDNIEWSLYSSYRFAERQTNSCCYHCDRLTCHVTSLSYFHWNLVSYQTITKQTRPETDFNPSFLGRLTDRKWKSSSWNTRTEQGRAYKIQVLFPRRSLNPAGALFTWTADAKIRWSPE